MTIFFRLLSHDDKGAALGAAVDALRDGYANPDVHAVQPTSFRQVPGAPFAYWVSEHIRHLFEDLPTFLGHGWTAQHGASTKDDFRFVRTWWEIDPRQVLDGENSPFDHNTDFAEWCKGRTSQGKSWVAFAKGGEYSSYYIDIHLLVNWKQNGGELEKHLLRKYPYLGNNANWVLHRECSYFYPGLTWSRRTTSGLSIRVLPRGCIFADKGPSAFASTNELDCCELPRSGRRARVSA